MLWYPSYTISAEDLGAENQLLMHKHSPRPPGLTDFPVNVLASIKPFGGIFAMFHHCIQSTDVFDSMKSMIATLPINFLQ